LLFSFSSDADSVAEVTGAALALQLPLAFISPARALISVAGWSAASGAFVWSAD